MDKFSTDFCLDYKYIDVAFGGAGRRNSLIMRHELGARFQAYSAAHKPIDCFSTYFWYPNAMAEYFKSNDNSVKGYDGPVYAEIIPVDIDDKTDLKKAHDRAKKAIHLLEGHEIDLKILRTYFSGYKGFHEVPSVLFGVEPATRLNEVFKKIVQRLLPDIPFDPVNYDKVRLWRLPNTVNSKTGLYKIPLSAHELMTLTIDEIRKMAEHPRDSAVLWDDDVGLNANLCTLYKELEQSPNQRSENSSNKLISLEDLFRCDFIKHCYNNRETLTEPYWYHTIGIITRLPGGREYAHAISRGYPGYDQKETDEKILHSLDVNPVTCEYIHHTLDFTCAQDCDVRSPIVLLSRKSVSIERPAWPEPIPLNEYSSLPAFPLHVLPSWCRNIAEKVAHVNQVDTGLTGSILLGVLSTCIAKKARVNLITHQEPVNLYISPICESGERKTSTMAPLTEPLYRYQTKKQEEMRPVVAQYEADLRILQNRLDKLEKEAAKSSGADADKCREDARAMARQIAETPVLHPPVYIADDITTEQVGILASENDERLSVISPEGGIFITMAGRYSNGYTAIDIYLKGHPGDAWSNERVGRKRISMASPALTLCLTVQPEIIRQIGGNKEFHGRGLLARFLYALCTPRAGYRMRQTSRLDPETIETYRKHVYRLMGMPVEQATLRLTREAQDKWDEFYNDVESQIRPGGKLEPIKEWGSKLAGAVARIAGLLHFAEHMQKAPYEDISVNIVNASCTIGFYYLEHALAAFGLMRQDERVEAAKKILEYVLCHKPHSFKGRDVLRHKSIFKTVDDVQPGLTVLLDRGYIREVASGYSGRGRPENIAYAVNPLVYRENRTLNSIDNNDKNIQRENSEAEDSIDNNDKNTDKEIFVNTVDDSMDFVQENDEPIAVGDPDSDRWQS